MGHKDSKREWKRLSRKEQEKLFSKVNDTWGTLPTNLSGSEIDNLVGTAKKKGFWASLFSSDDKSSKDTFPKP